VWVVNSVQALVRAIKLEPQSVSHELLLAIKDQLHYGAYWLIQGGILGDLSEKVVKEFILLVETMHRDILPQLAEPLILSICEIFKTNKSKIIKMIDLIDSMFSTMMTVEYDPRTLISIFETIACARSQLGLKSVSLLDKIVDIDFDLISNINREKFIKLEELLNTVKNPQDKTIIAFTHKLKKLLEKKDIIPAESDSELTQELVMTIEQIPNSVDQANTNPDNTD